MLYPIVASSGRSTGRHSRRANSLLARAAYMAAGRRVKLEALEERRLLSAAVSGNVLTIIGTNAADTISVQMQPGSSTTLQVTVNGLSQTFPVKGLNQINIEGANGDDSILVNSNFSIKTAIVLGTGNNTVIANSNDTVFPGSGENVVSTNGGNSFTLMSSTPTTPLPKVAAASSITDSDDFTIGPNSLSAIGSGVISPVDTVGYNTIADIENDYGVSDPVLTSMNGHGQYIGIVDGYAGPALTQAAIAADINTFSNDSVNGVTEDGVQLPDVVAGTTFKLFGPSTTPALSQVQEDDAETETLLDVEYAHAMAPNATIYLFQSPDMTTANLMATVAEAGLTISNTSAGGGVVSMSFGGPEFATEFMYDDSIFAQYPTVSFIAAAGDTVEEDSYPAMSPYVTSVGGTTLTTEPQIESSALKSFTNAAGTMQMYVVVTPYSPYAETAWGNTTVGNEGGGGGFSEFEPVPVYQTSPTTVLKDYPLESDGDGNTPEPIITANQEGFGETITSRSGPDVAMVANPETGVAVYLTVGGFSGWEEVGGTSLSAPLFAGVVTLANQERNTFFGHESPLGVDLNPAIYTIGDQQYVEPLTVSDAVNTSEVVAQNDGYRNGGELLSESASQGTLTVMVTFASETAPGEFYDLGGLTQLTMPGPDQGGDTAAGLDQSTGWGSPNVNYLVPFSFDANSDDDSVDTMTYAINLTNIKTASLGQPIYDPDNPVDLVITKTADNLTPNVNGTVTYTVTVSDPAGTNSSGVAFGDATDITVTDNLPGGQTLDSANLSAPADTFANGIWTIPSLSVGGSDSLTIVATVNEFAPQTNTATITGQNQVNDNTNLAASVTINPQQVNLSIQDTVNNATPLEGSDVVYTITVSNAAGSSNATNISVSNPLPAGETLESFAPSSAEFSNGVWTIPVLAPGASTSLSYVAQVNQLGLQVNEASITGAAQFDIGTNLSSSNTINSVSGIANLAITKSVNNTTPNVGSDVTYSIIVSNALGATTATDISISDVLPGGETLLSDSTSVGTYDPSIGVWNIPSLAAGVRATLTYVASVNTFTPMTNTASITNVDQLDIGVNLSASATINPQEADLVLAKSVSNNTPTINSDVTYTLTVTEGAGFSVATNVLVTDILPSGESLVSSNPAVGTFVGGVWNIPTLAANTPAVLTYVVQVNSQTPQTNTATLTKVDQPDVGNTTASVTINPVGAVDLSVVKVAAPTTPAIGSNVNYSITVSNAAGFDTATNVDVKDLLPTGETIVSESPSVGTYNSTTGLWVIPTLAAGASAQLNYLVTIVSAQPQTNTATITGVDQIDVGTNLSSSVTVTPQTPQVNLSITKAVTNTTPQVGSDIEYSVTVSNASGYSTATNIVVTDAVPAGETLLSSVASAGTYTNGVWNIPSLASGASAVLTYFVSVNNLSTQTNVATIASEALPDVGTVLTSTTIVVPTAQVISTNIKASGFTTANHATGPTSGSNAIVDNYSQNTSVPSTAGVTFGATTTLSLVLQMVDTNGNLLTIDVTGVPLTQTSATKYKFATEVTLATGTAGFVGDELWLTGTVTISKKGALSVNGSFYEIQGLNGKGKPVAWGKNGPSGGGGDVEGQFSS
jgi:uncharacterized repeat protein (TIGR01451 family)